MSKMVLKTICLCAKRKNLRGFIDSLRLTVKAGSGGNGLPKYGGVGGPGGNIYCIAKDGQTLKKIEQKFTSKRVSAGHGGNSHPKRILGEVGEHQLLEVPVGVTVHRNDGSIIGELNTDGDRILVAKGGYGGNYRTGFFGVKGQSQTIRLDLKLIADIGLVGFPNAGKSTFLKAVSNAKPKIASYPFTTIKPNIGIMEYKNLRKISVADLPGLIEGAHANIGMGHNFLKHVERTKMLLLIVDINGFQLNPKYQFRSCLDTIILLNKELELYKSELLDKPAAIIINKMDTPNAQKLFDEIKNKIENLSDSINNYPEEIRPKKSLIFDDILPMSAKLGDRNEFNYIKERLKELVDLNAEIARQKEIEEQAKLINELKNETIIKTPGSIEFHR